MSLKPHDFVKHNKYGKGVVILIRENQELPYGVRFNKYNNQLHDLFGACTNGHGWYCDESDLTLTDPKPLEQGDLVEFPDGTRGIVESPVCDGFIVRFANNKLRTIATQKELTLVT